MRMAFLVVLLTLCLPAHAANLPSRDPQVVLPLLTKWHEHGSYARVLHILGAPDTDIESGFSITVFRLKDGTSIYVKATPSRHRIYTINRSAPGGLAETLYEPLAGDLDYPPPVSAPF